MGAEMFSPIGIGMGAVGMIGKMITRGKNNREMEKLIGQDPTYAINPLAQQRLGLAQTLLNARMPGSQLRENRIYGAQGNQSYNIGRTATDSAQALAMGAVAQGQTNQAFGDMAQDEANNYYRNLTNLNQAQEGMIAEGDKVYQDNVRRFGDKVQFKGAQAENRGNNWSDLSNFGMGLADFGMNGGFEGMFKKKQQKTPQFY